VFSIKLNKKYLLINHEGAIFSILTNVFGTR